MTDNPQAALPEPMDERAKFEAAMRPIFPLWTFQDDGTGGYHNNLTEAARIAWEVRASVRPLGREEIDGVMDDLRGESLRIVFDAIQRKFCEVNGLKLAAISATTKEN